MLEIITEKLYRLALTGTLNDGRNLLVDGKEWRILEFNRCKNDQKGGGTADPNNTLGALEAVEDEAWAPVAGSVAFLGGA